MVVLRYSLCNFTHKALALADSGIWRDPGLPGPEFIDKGSYGEGGFLRMRSGLETGNHTGEAGRGGLETRAQAGKTGQGGLSGIAVPVGVGFIRQRCAGRCRGCHHQGERMFLPGGLGARQNRHFDNTVENGREVVRQLDDSGIDIRVVVVV
jgi:hypothetical protein